MKKILVIFILVCGFNMVASAQTWSEWFKQKKTQTKYSLLQIAKLQIYLEYVKKGYDIAQKGLTLVGDIKDGDFKLHDLFFSDLLKVKSTVKNYSKVSEIYSIQQQIRSSCRNQRKNWNSEFSSFTNDERLLLQQQQDKMLAALADDLAALEDVLTDENLQLSDDERIKRIDLIYSWVSDKKEWTSTIDRQCLLLNAQRQHSLKDVNTLKGLH